MLCSLLQIPSSGACQAAINKAREDGRLAGARFSQQEQGKAHPTPQSSAEGAQLVPLASACKSTGAVAAGLSRLWEAVHLTVPSPRLHSQEWPPDSQVHQAGLAWTLPQGHHPPAPTVVLSLWSRP